MSQTQPAWLSDRYDLERPDKWKPQNSIPLLETMNANWQTGEFTNTQSATAQGRAISRLTMIKAKFGITDYERLNITHELSEQTQQSADIVATLKIYEKAKYPIKDIPQISGKTVGQHAKNLAWSELVHHTARMALTYEYKKFMTQLKDLPKEQKDLLRKMSRELRAKSDYNTNLLANTNHVDYEGGSPIRLHNCEAGRARIARTIDHYAKMKIEPQDQTTQQTGKGKSTKQTEEELGFEKLLISKPSLDLNHSGRMGRRKRASTSGKQPERMANYYADQQKRIFTNKTKSLGAVVLVDMSGSMSLSDDELEQILEASHGATVIGYSHGEFAEANCWLMARNNRRMRGLPNPGGGNGVDVPALYYASTFLKNHSPFIWISDGMATGKVDSSTPKIMKITAKVASKLGVTMAENAPSAIQLLKEAQRGKKPKPYLNELLRRRT